MVLTATRPLEDIDATSPEILQDPYSYYDRLRAEAPVFRDPKTGIVSVSTYDLVLEVNKKPKLFSSEFGDLLSQGGTGQRDPEEVAISARGLGRSDTMLTADPPAHTRYKRIAMKAFPLARVQAMTPYIAEVSNMLIDRFIASGEVEFKSQFADQLPSIVIIDAIGASRDEIPQFLHWLKGTIGLLNGNANREQRLDYAQRLVDLQRYMVGAMAERRKHPTGDVVSDIVHARVADEGDRHLNDDEAFSIINQILTAGQEATAHALTYAVYQLLRNPSQLAKVKADRSLVPNLVEETVRHLTPSHNMWRIVKEDTELGGVALKAGEPMWLRYGSANRDEARFPNAADFDVARANAREHLAFGAGIHTCLGMALARQEMCTALPIILDRLRKLRFEDGENSFQFGPSPILRGATSLKLRFDPG
jgi:cytochrome P450